MEERELTQLLQQLGDRVTPSPPPVRRIVDAGESLRGRRSGRVRVIAMAAAAAAVIGGGAVAATVIDLPSGGADAQSAAGDAASGVDDSGAGEGEPPRAETGGGTGTEEGAAAADAAASVVVTPYVLRPGETFDLTSRDEEAAFGLAWYLERRTGDAWSREYTLGAAFRNGEPGWWPEGESWVVVDVRVHAPLEFVLPPDLPTGDYRLCENDAPDVCADLVVTG